MRGREIARGIATLPLRSRVGALLVVALSSCARLGGADTNETECTGAAPVCFEPIGAGAGCCADAGAPAECGPKDAPKGTHTKWVCPGKSVRSTECTAYGAVCAVPVDQVAPVLATPHAVPLAGDPLAGGLPQGYMSAAIGTVLLDQTDALSTSYAVRRYTTRANAAPGGIKEHQDLYFGKDRLTERRYFLAPDGDAVVFEDGSGKTIVHGAASGKRRAATPRPLEPPTGATWDTQKRSVTVTFAKHAPTTVRAP